MNDVDLLMSRITEINAKSPLDLRPDDITNLIAYYRQQRARRAAGEKATKPALEKVHPSITLDQLLAAGPTLPKALTPPPTPTRITRR